MAQQANGYDCGVSVLAATRELATRLVNGQAPEAGTLQLGDVVADRPALQVRLGGNPLLTKTMRRTRNSIWPGRGRRRRVRETKANGKPGGGRGSSGGSAEAEEPGPHRRAGRSHRGRERGGYR